MKQAGKVPESEALAQVLEKVIDSPNFGGLGLGSSRTTEATPQQVSESLFLVEAWLDSVTSAERAKGFLSYLPSAAPGTKPMTLAQKIFAQHVIGDKPAQGLVAGDVVRVGVDWILASELSWAVSKSSHILPFLLHNDPVESHSKNMCTNPVDTYFRSLLGNGQNTQGNGISRDLAKRQVLAGRRPRLPPRRLDQSQDPKVAPGGGGG